VKYEKIKECWKVLVEGGVKMIYPGHGKSFPMKIMKESLAY
jgi:hypothetical protein